MKLGQKSIKVQKKGKWYIAEYTTLDLVTQGLTKEKALLNLLDIIVMQIDFAVENDNVANILLPISASKL